MPGWLVPGLEVLQELELAALLAPLDQGDHGGLDEEDDDDCYFHDEKNGIDHRGDHHVQKYFQSFNSMTNASCK